MCLEVEKSRRSMASLSVLLRTIRQEPKFDEQLETLGIACKRLDDIMEAVCFALSRSPDIYPKIPGTCLRVLKTVIYPDSPSLRIFFTFSHEEVHLLTIEFCDEEVVPDIVYQE